MEKNVVFWALGIVVVAAVLFNVSTPTGNVTKESNMEPVIAVTNSPIRPGQAMQVSIRDAHSTSQEFKIFEANGDYSGSRFFARSSRCGKRKLNGAYDCDLQYRFSPSTESGSYYIQGKDRRGNFIGNKAKFTVN